MRMRADITFVKTTLEQQELFPNKRLGQNFCIDSQRLRACLDRLELSALPVLEVGPGLGALTEELLARAPSVLAVEKDAVLSAYLEQSLKHERLTLFTMDALSLKREQIPHPFAAVGNLPYYVTTKLCLHLLSLEPEIFACMVQKEAGDRFFAKSGDDSYGPLSIVSQLWYRCETLARFPESSFYPEPNVQSVFVALWRRAFAPKEDCSKVAAFAAGLLAMRRKTLRNNLKGDERTQKAAEALGIDLSLRAETLSPEQFLALYQQSHT